MMCVCAWACAFACLDSNHATSETRHSWSYKTFAITINLIKYFKNLKADTQAHKHTHRHAQGEVKILEARLAKHAADFFWHLSPFAVECDLVGGCWSADFMTYLQPSNLDPQFPTDVAQLMRTGTITNVFFLYFFPAANVNQKKKPSPKK